MTKSTPTIAPEIENLTVPIADLKLWPGNPRQGDVGAISESLKRFGQVKPLLVQKATMRIVAGNHVYRAASALGWDRIAAVLTDMTDKQAKAFLAADNRMSELGSFDNDMLAVLLADIARNDSLEGTGYDEEDLEALLARVGAPTKYGQGDPDGSTNVPSEPWVKPGQIFALGPHRIGCGEPTDAMLDRLLDGESIDLLLVTPPPAFSPVKLATYFGKVAEQFWFGAEKYIEDLAPPEKGGWLVWDKGTSDVDGLGNAFELIWTKQHHPREILRETRIGAADGEKRGGPDFTERPSALWSGIYERWSGFEAIVCDPYAHGATSLLGAEKSGRMWYGLKANPAFVQGVVEKWVTYSGIDPQEIGSAP